MHGMCLCLGIPECVRILQMMCVCVCVLDVCLFLGMYLSVCTSCKCITGSAN